MAQDNYPPENEDLEGELENLAPPPGRTEGNYTSQGDVLGILPTSGNPSPLAPLFEGSEDFALWAVRGNRPMAVAVAEVEVGMDNAVLLSETFPIRGDHMKKVTAQRAYHTLFSQGKPKLQKMEFFGLLAFGATIFATVFLVTTVYAP